MVWCLRFEGYSACVESPEEGSLVSVVSPEWGWCGLGTVTAFLGCGTGPPCIKQWKAGKLRMDERGRRGGEGEGVAPINVMGARRQVASDAVADEEAKEHMIYPCSMFRVPYCERPKNKTDSLGRNMMSTFHISYSAWVLRFRQSTFHMREREDRTLLPQHRVALDAT